MEGVEDIPGAALSAGIRWDWETFPEYLDALARMPRALDIGAQVPHGAVRAYVMGDRGAANEPATPDDIATMGRLVRRGDRGGRARLHDLAHPRASWGRWAAGAGHVRGRGRADRHRARARRRGARRLRGCGSGDGRSHRRRSARRCRGGGRLDGAAVGVDEASRELPRHAERGGPGRVAAAAGARRRGSGAGCRARPAGGRASLRDAGRPPVAREPVRRSTDLPHAGVAAARRARDPAPRSRGAAPHPGRAPGERRGAGHPVRAPRARDVSAPLSPRRAARLRAHGGDERGGRRGARGPSPGSGALRSHAAPRRSRAALLPGAQLRRVHGRADPRDDPAPALGPRPGRRWRPLRHHLRRQHDDVHADALGARPAARTAHPARDGGPGAHP